MDQREAYMVQYGGLTKLPIKILILASRDQLHEISKVAGSFNLDPAVYCANITTAATKDRLIETMTREVPAVVLIFQKLRWRGINHYLTSRLVSVFENVPPGEIKALIETHRKRFSGA